MVDFQPHLVDFQPLEVDFQPPEADFQTHEFDFQPPKVDLQPPEVDLQHPMVDCQPLWLISNTPIGLIITPCDQISTPGLIFLLMSTPFSTYYSPTPL